jgi:hypothetical protein
VRATALVGVRPLTARCTVFTYLYVNTSQIDSPPIVLHMNEAAHVLELLKISDNQNSELKSSVRASIRTWTARNRSCVCPWHTAQGPVGGISTERGHGDSEDGGTLVIVIGLCAIDRMIFPNI